jgi:hypothetical protein
MINLFISYYISRNREHQDEIDHCFRKNLDNLLIDNIYVFVAKRIHFPFGSVDGRLHLIDIERPRYSDVITFINSKPDFKESYNIISNSDIYYDETLQSLDKIDFLRKTCLALSRHEVDGSGNIVHVHSKEFLSLSQDSWIFKGHIKINNNDVNFYMGIPGCDNRLAFELSKNNFNVLNLHHDIKIYHYHLHRMRKIKDRISKPYKYIEVTKL